MSKETDMARAAYLRQKAAQYRRQAGYAEADGDYSQAEKLYESERAALADATALEYLHQ